MKPSPPQQRFKPPVSSRLGTLSPRQAIPVSPSLRSPSLNQNKINVSPRLSIGEETLISPRSSMKPFLSSQFMAKGETYFKRPTTAASPAPITTATAPATPPRPPSARPQSASLRDRPGTATSTGLGAAAASQLRTLCYSCMTFLMLLVDSCERYLEGIPKERLRVGASARLRSSAVSMLADIKCLRTKAQGELMKGFLKAHRELTSTSSSQSQGLASPRRQSVASPQPTPFAEGVVGGLTFVEVLLVSVHALIESAGRVSRDASEGTNALQGTLPEVLLDAAGKATRACEDVSAIVSSAAKRSTDSSMTHLVDVYAQRRQIITTSLSGASSDGSSMTIGHLDKGFPLALLEQVDQGPTIAGQPEGSPASAGSRASSLRQRQYPAFMLWEGSRSVFAGRQERFENMAEDEAPQAANPMESSGVGFASPTTATIFSVFINGGRASIDLSKSRPLSAGHHYLSGNGHRAARPATSSGAAGGARTPRAEQPPSQVAVKGVIGADEMRWAAYVDRPLSPMPYPDAFIAHVASMLRLKYDPMSGSLIKEQHQGTPCPVEISQEAFALISDYLKTLQRRWHPDRFASVDLQPASSEGEVMAKVTRIAQAVNSLKDALARHV